MCNREKWRKRRTAEDQSTAAGSERTWPHFAFLSIFLILWRTSLKPVIDDCPKLFSGSLPGANNPRSPLRAQILIAPYQSLINAVIVRGMALMSGGPRTSTGGTRTSPTMRKLELPMSDEYEYGCFRYEASWGVHFPSLSWNNSDRICGTCILIYKPP